VAAAIRRANPTDAATVALLGRITSAGGGEDTYTLGAQRFVVNIMERLLP
jgi:hypothetical protein